MSAVTISIDDWQARRRQWEVGGVVVLAAHGLLVTVLSLTPTPGIETGAAVARPAQTPLATADEVEGCMAVVNPAAGAERHQLRRCDACTAPEGRRCAEPLRRLMRRDSEPAPAVEVDLLEAMVIERLGVPDGERVAKPEVKRVEERVAKVKELVASEQQVKLSKILAGDDEARERKSKLRRILGTATGRPDGDGLVARQGSAYVRDVRIAVQQRFVLPGNVPVWERKNLWARVRITRMTASGGVLAFGVERKSGNDAFDQTVASLLGRYKAGLYALPAPPPHILAEINSRGMVIELRGGQ